MMWPEPNEAFAQAGEWLRQCTFKPFGVQVKITLASDMSTEWSNDHPLWSLRLYTRLPDTYAPEPEPPQHTPWTVLNPDLLAMPMDLPSSPPKTMALSAGRMFAMPHSLADFKREVLDFVTWFGAHEALECLKHDGNIVHNPHTDGEPYVSVPNQKER